MADLPAPLQKIFKHIDENKAKYIENLKEAVAIKSVSASAHHRNEIIEIMQWADKRLKALGCCTELRDIGDQTLPNGSKIPLPPILLGTRTTDVSKKTVCIYGHLDVQPALKEDGWKTDPFVLTQIDDKLFGRGSSDDKGPVLGWFHALEAYIALGIDIPVNLKFCLEGMEESGSAGLKELLIAEKDKWLKGVDYVCISDNDWLGTEKPCITYGLRGICYFYIDIECASMDLHSGEYGGTVPEAMSDLVYLMGTLEDKDGNILVPDISNDVAPLGANEQSAYNQIAFDVPAFRALVGTQKLLHDEDKVQLLMHKNRYPSLSLHGIEGAAYEPGQKTVIPGKVIGKFSIRIVPNQTPDKVENCVVKYLNEQWQKRGSSNKMKAFMVYGSEPWMEDPSHPHYIAGKKATKHVYKVEPDLIRSGGSIPITLTFQQVAGKNVMLLPMGAGDDSPHSQKEKIDLRNYIEGTKLQAAYIYEVGQLK